MQNLMRPWPEYTYVAFDTETSGAYPLGADVVEFGAVKWKDGKEIDRLQFLLKPREPMSAFIIGIHGITNEMVAEAPLMAEKIQSIKDFFEGSILMAHHAPFDMGFIGADFEKYKIQMPFDPVICTSLLARKIIQDSANHKLQTLIRHLNLEQGAAHRAADDAKACLEVGLHCMRQMGESATLGDVLKVVEKNLVWKNYCLLQSADQKILKVVEALDNRKDLDINYEGGSLRGQNRRISPIGIVRNPDGDYVMAKCHIDGAQKRFYLNKMNEVEIVY